MRAREAYFRAATYYRAAYLPLIGAPVDPRLVAAFEREEDAFRRAAALSDPLIEPVEIPFEGTSRPGYFLRAAGGRGAAPAVVHVNGYDSNIQEMYFAHGPAGARTLYDALR